MTGLRLSVLVLVLTLSALHAQSRCSVGEVIAPTDQNCDTGESCVSQTKCPQFQNEKVKLKASERGSKEYKESLQKLRKFVCNKSKKGVCCPGPKCLKEAQCPHAQALRKKFQKGDQTAKQELIGLICDRKDRTFCCPYEEEKNNPKIIQVFKKNNPEVGEFDPSWLPEKGKCGLPHPDGTTSRVVGGVDTRPGQFPFTALLGSPIRKRQWNEVKVKWEVVKLVKYKCGGTLINHWYVVTAAHCHGKSARKRITDVRLGEWEVGRKEDCLEQNREKIYCLDPVQDFSIEEGQVTVHEDYMRTIDNIVNDIALIKLPRPAELTNSVQFPCLPLNPSQAASDLNVDNIQDGLEGTRPVVVGWGYQEYDPWAAEAQGDFKEANVASKVQQKLGVPVLGDRECTQKWGGKLKALSNQICAGGEEGKDSCKGDSGGPLYLAWVEETGEPASYGNHPWYFLGIVSFGSRNCGTGKPAVYTRVESFLPWIRKNIGTA